VKQYSNQEGVSEQTLEKINNIWTNYLSQIQETNDIHRVDALTVYSNDAKENYQRIIRREIDGFHLKNTENKGSTTTVADSKPIRQVKITSLVQSIKLETEQDIDNYLDELSRELKQRIQMNQIIEIID
jgi:uncharacterized protein (DUF885 family)